KSNLSLGRRSRRSVAIVFLPTRKLLARPRSPGNDDQRRFGFSSLCFIKSLPTFRSQTPDVRDQREPCASPRSSEASAPLPATAYFAAESAQRFAVFASRETRNLYSPPTPPSRTPSART